MNAEEVRSAAQYLVDAQHVACLTGAGVSAESGVPTFRDAQSGLWSRFDPEELASQAGFAADPGLVWRWYMSRLGMVEQTTPNPSHEALALLEPLVPKFTLITQNVDDLHERAGSSSVVHLHGRITRFRCNRCRAMHTLLADERTAQEPPRCRDCGELVRPDVVWFGEMLPRRAFEIAEKAARECDFLIVVGTSGVIYPAATIPHRAKMSGAIIVDVNPVYGATAETADLFLQGRGGDVLPILLEEVRALKKSRVQCSKRS